MINYAPIAVGGVGGSGTRVVAAILEEAGLWMGGDLNEARDNLWFTLLFKHPGILGTSEHHFEVLVSLFRAAMDGNGAAPPPDLSLLDDLVTSGRPQHDAPWLGARATSLRLAISARRRAPTWGWKEPNTHIVVDRLPAHISGLKYIHVARSGLDMAFSQNQNQLRLWGPTVLGGDHAVNPRNSLRFWCWAHTRILKVGEGMGERFLFLRYEDLCREPARHVPLILSFVGVQPDREMVDRAIRMIEPPASIGRHSTHSMAHFDPDDVAYVRQLGFVA